MTDEFVVKDDAVRPARPDGTCFYCYEPLGGIHRQGCVLRTKVVEIEVTIRMTREVPEHFTDEDIEFQLNESSWCADNIVDDIAAYAEARNAEEKCLCDRFTARVVPTTEDES